MRTRSSLPWLLATALAVGLPAQESVKVRFGAAVVVQFGSTDPAPNLLVSAILAEPEVETAVRAIVGAGVAWDPLDISSRPLPTGTTYQFWFHVGLQSPNELPRATQDAIVDAVFAHLARRVIELTYDEPRRLLQQREAELAARHEELTRTHAELRARTTRTDEELATLRKLAEVVAHDLQQAQLDLATEERAIQFLEKARAEQFDLRANLRSSKATADALASGILQRLDGLNIRLRPLTGTTPAEQAERKALAEELRTLQGELEPVRREQAQLDENLAEVREQLARNLEQLPTSALTLVRARAQVAALEDRQKQLEKRREESLALLQKGAEVTARAELVRIDLDVCRTLLTEVRTRLGRLEPMRCQLLRQ